MKLKLLGTLLFLLPLSALQAQLNTLPELQVLYPTASGLSVEDCLYDPHYDANNHIDYHSITSTTRINYERNKTGLIEKSTVSGFTTSDYIWVKNVEKSFTYANNRLASEQAIEWQTQRLPNMDSKDRPKPEHSEEKIYTLSPSKNTETLSTNFYDAESNKHTLLEEIRYLNKHSLPDSIHTYLLAGGNKELIRRAVLTYNQKQECVSEKKYFKASLTNPSVQKLFPEWLMTAQDSKNEWWQECNISITRENKSISLLCTMPNAEVVYKIKVDYDDKGRVVFQQVARDNYTIIKASFSYDSNGRTLIEKEFNIHRTGENNNVALKYKEFYNTSGEQVSLYNNTPDDEKDSSLSEVIYSYTPSQKLATYKVNFYKPNLNHYLRGFMVENFLNEENLVSKSVRYNREGQDQEWEKKSTFFYEYDSKHNPTLYEEYDTNEEGIVRKLRTYDDNGYVLSEESFSWYDEEWKKSQKEIFEYTADGKITSTQTYEWNRHYIKWEGISKENYTYNQQDSTASNISYNWNRATNDWMPTTQRKYTYTPISQTEEIREYVENNWKPTKAYTTTTEGNKRSRSSMEWDDTNNKWQETTREVYITINDSITDTQQYRYDEELNQIVGTSRIYKESARESLTSAHIIWYKWDRNANDWIYDQQYKENKADQLVTKTLESYDAQAKQWANYKKVTCLTQGDEATYEMHIWNKLKKEWTGIKRIIYRLDEQNAEYIWNTASKSWIPYTKEETDEGTNLVAIYYKWNEDSYTWKKYKSITDSDYHITYYEWNQASQKWLLAKKAKEDDNFDPETNFYSFELHDLYF